MSGRWSVRRVAPAVLSLMATAGCGGTPESQPVTILDPCDPETVVQRDLTRGDAFPGTESQTYVRRDGSACRFVGGATR